jgi:UDP-N-acetylglucosamine/UDP-N-acetylgalactosamine diphosphorylase
MPGVGDISTVKRDKDELHRHLAAFGQEHVLAFWDELDEAARDKLAAELERLDFELLDALFRRPVAAEDWAGMARRAAAPAAFRLHQRQGSIAAEQAHERGGHALAAGHVGVVLVAGGQGTRLGFEHPKGMFAIGPVSGASLFQILFEKVAARSRAAGMRIPLYLMTSPATHEETLAYLSANEFFGLPRDDVGIFCQGTMPAVDAQSGLLLLASKGELALSPDGHGGTLEALRASGCLADIRARGLRQLFYCQVDNPLVDVCDPAFLGYHLLASSEVSTLVVAKRHSRERVGNVVSIDGKLRILEYSDLNPLADEIVERRGADGGPVFWAGNTAIHVFDVAFLESMAAAGAALPFHLARKAVSHVDSAGRAVEPREPNAIKFERFIFDLLPAARRAIVVEVDPAVAFAPVKNAPGEACDTPESAQAQMIALHAGWLRAAGCDVASGVPVEVSPLFAQNAEELAAQIRSGMAVTAARYFC